MTRPRATQQGRKLTARVTEVLRETFCVAGPAAAPVRFSYYHQVVHTPKFHPLKTKFSMRRCQLIRHAEDCANVRSSGGMKTAATSGGNDLAGRTILPIACRGEQVLQLNP